MATPCDHWQLLNDIVDMSNNEHIFAAHPNTRGSNPKEVGPMWNTPRRLQELNAHMAAARPLEKTKNPTAEVHQLLIYIDLIVDVIGMSD